MSLPDCPKCSSQYAYETMGLFACPECFHEWTQADTDRAHEASIIRDAFGNELNDGDDVTVIKDLKVRGSSETLKQGTRGKSISLLEDPVDGHDISCRVDGFGFMNLKSEIVKKL